MKDIIIMNVYWDHTEEVDQFMTAMDSTEKMILNSNGNKIWTDNKYLVRSYQYTTDTDLLSKIAEAQQLWYGSILFQTKDIIDTKLNIKIVLVDLPARIRIMNDLVQLVLKRIWVWK